MASVLIFALSGAAIATPVTLETLIVNSASVPGYYFSTVLATGQHYTLEASGSFQFDAFARPHRVADAEFRSDDDFATINNAPGIDLLVIYGDVIGAAPTFSTVANAQDVLWSATYNPAHIYSFDLVGNGGTLGLVVDDSYYLDNIGDLTVNLLFDPDPKPGEVPEPTGIALFSLGLVGLLYLRRRKPS